MIFWYTGQPGHGKTLHAIDHAIDFRDKGRLVYVCNVAQFDYEKARMLKMEPEQFRDWMNFLPDGAVALVDEAYEHNMLPKRPPSAGVPPHVQQLAKHRHRGLDFIFVSQSPQTQCDSFVHDLIEQHIHVRRMWGLPFVRLRKFFYMERNPLKAAANVVKLAWLPKRPRGLYLSTAMDTTERHVPWYVILLTLGIPSVLFGAWYMVNDVETSLTGTETVIEPAGKPASGAGENGAVATIEPATKAPPPSRELRTTDYAAWLTPRIPAQPWTAPAYDTISVPSRPPRVFCGSSGLGADKTCSCISEQGTKYLVDLDRCLTIVKNGQYEPLLDNADGELRRLDDVAQLRDLREGEEQVKADVSPLLPFGGAVAPPAGQGGP